jgi:hypothetical protein
MYETLRNEFERLEERGTNLTNNERNDSQQTTPSHGISSPTTPLSTSSSTTSSSILAIASALISPSTHIGSIGSQSVPNSPIKATFEVLDRLAAHICGQLLHYVKARIEMMEIYEKITVISSQKFCLFDDCIKTLHEIIKLNQKHFHHPMLSSIKTGFNFECDILMALLRAQTDIQNWKFLNSLFSLQEAHTKLSSWAAMALNRESPQRKSSILRAPIVPPLYQWLCKVKSTLISKYSLYFSTILSKQVPNNSAIDMKSVCAKQSIDYIQKVITFQRKTDAQFISIVFDTHGVDDYRGFGYHSPFKTFETPKGIDSFPIIYSYPTELPKNHLPTLIMIMNNKYKELNGSDCVISLFDPQVNTTYFLLRPDPKMTFIVIFESKKSEKDSYVLTFLQEICSQLKGNKIFASLKPGVK